MHARRTPRLVLSSGWLIAGLLALPLSAGANDPKPGHTKADTTKTTGETTKSGTTKAGDTKSDTNVGDTDTANTAGSMNDAKTILSKIHHTNETEIKLGEHVRSKGANKDVKEYATHLVKDHKDADQKVMSLAKQKNVTLATPEPATAEERAMMDKHKAAADRIMGLSGAELDREYTSTMAEAHADVIQMLKTARDGTQDKDVRSLIDKMMPALEQHRDRASALSTKVKGEPKG